MIYDITPPISESLAVWPGDTSPRREVLLDMGRGDNITVSTLRATVHLGAHADAPSHYGVNAPAVHEANLDYYLGPCQVLRVSLGRAMRLVPAMLSGRVRTERLLLVTGSFPNPEHFNQDFASLSWELVEFLHRQGVKLIGIDTPSVDLFDSKSLPSHKMCLQCGMAILE